MFIKNTFLALVIGGQCVPLVPMGSKTKPVIFQGKDAPLVLVDSGSSTTSNRITVVHPTTGQPTSLSINDRLPGRDDTYMHYAAATAKWEKLQQLIDCGGDIEVRTGSGKTPLHIAVMEGQLLNVGCLLMNRANPKAQEAWGLTPINLAETMQVLCSHNAAHLKFMRLMVAMLQFFAAHA